MEQRIEIIVSNKETAELLLELILHSATKAHLSRHGAVTAVASFDADAGLPDEGDTLKFNIKDLDDGRETSGTQG